jgi:hypothetical protein
MSYCLRHDIGTILVFLRFYFEIGSVPKRLMYLFFRAEGFIYVFYAVSIAATSCFPDENSGRLVLTELLLHLN